MRLSQSCHSGFNPESNLSILIENNMLNQVQHDNYELLQQRHLFVAVKQKPFYSKFLIFSKILFLLSIILFITGCSSGSRFSKESLISNTRLFSIDKSFSALLPLNYKLIEDNLNETVLIWFVNNNNEESLIIKEINSVDKELQTIAAIVKASKKQIAKSQNVTETEFLTIENKKSAYFLLEGNELQYVFIFGHKNKFYEISSISKISNSERKEKLFHLTKEIISSIK